MLVPGSGDVSFCGVVLNMALYEEVTQEGACAARDRFVTISVSQRHLRGLDGVICSGKEE